ncbi:DUF3829 domain-containing protein [Flavobacterium sp. 316]|uniref:DUF3829 domain-containing protein n=1 Tax=Flavobacterium sp. 316 TaxID=1603293 RepID=UPI000A7DDE9A|nr:DUF3829 domain-containing protein [Flavobacterium sp. 316]
MKKIILSALLFSTLLACKNDSTSPSGNLFETTNEADTNESANKVISYYNAFIEYDSSTSKKIDNLLNNDYSKFEKMVTTKQKSNTILTWIAFTGLKTSTTVGYGTNQVDLMKPEFYLDDALAAKIKPLILEMSESFTATKNTYEEFKKYFVNEDYKDDNWEKGSQFLSDIDKNTVAFYKNRDEFLKIIDDNVSSAEEKILENHPIKDAILHTKKTLKIVDEMIVQVAEETTPIEVIEKAYSTLEERVKTSKEINQEKLKEQNKLDSFTDFYDEIETMLGSIRKAKRDGAISDNDYRDINYKYSNVISNYNRFVK